MKKDSSTTIGLIGGLGLFLAGFVVFSYLSEYALARARNGFGTTTAESADMSRYSSSWTAALFTLIRWNHLISVYLAVLCGVILMLLFRRVYRRDWTGSRTGLLAVIVILASLLWTLGDGILFRTPWISHGDIEMYGRLYVHSMDNTILRVVPWEGNARVTGAIVSAAGAVALLLACTTIFRSQVKEKKKTGHGLGILLSVVWIGFGIWLAARPTAVAEWRIESHYHLLSIPLNPEKLAALLWSFKENVSVVGMIVVGAGVIGLAIGFIRLLVNPTDPDRLYSQGDTSEG